MKKNKMILLTAAFVLALSSLAYAGYTKGFVVVGVSEDQVTIQKGEEKPIQVQVGKKTYHVGDKVKFDAEKGKMKRERRALEGC